MFEDITTFEEHVKLERRIGNAWWTVAWTLFLEVTRAQQCNVQWVIFIT